MVVPTILVESLFSMANLRLGLAFFHDRREDSEIMFLQYRENLVSDFLSVGRAMKEVFYRPFLPRKAFSEVKKFLTYLDTVHRHSTNYVVFTSSTIVFEHEATRFVCE